MDPIFENFDAVPGYELAAGVAGRALWGEHAMLNLITMEPNAVVPAHSHPHEQMGIVLEGSLVLEVAGEPHEAGPRAGFVLPGGVEHSATAGPDGAVVLDIFAPVREDLAEKADLARVARAAPADGAAPEQPGR
jgi:quercetin dioxygenase-like cupin family protein